MQNKHILKLSINDFITFTIHHHLQIYDSIQLLHRYHMQNVTYTIIFCSLTYCACKLPS